MQSWFKTFCKGDESLEDKGTVAGHRKLTTANCGQSSKLILLKLHEKLPKNSVLGWYYIWEVCLSNGWDALKTAASTAQHKGPDSSRQHPTARCTALQKLNESGFEVLPHPLYSPDLLPTDYSSFKHFYNFLQGKCFHSQQEAENAFQEHFCQILKHGFLGYRNKTNISCWQKMCWL